jgi:colicin import membrane protein
MINIKKPYRLPLLIALILHICLIAFLFMRIPTTNYRLPGPVAKTKVVQAVTIDAKQVQAQIASIQRVKAQKKAKQQAYLRHLKSKAAAARRARVKEERHLVRLKQQQKQLKQQKAVAAARLKDLQQQRAKVLKTQEQALKKKLLQQQLSAEQQQLARRKTSQRRGQINRYKAAILRAIGQHWMVPGGANKMLSAIYQIQLAPGGVVLSVKLLTSSGNLALDRSARVAIYKSSPLSVPKDPALFDNFRQLRLTMSPKTVVKE